MNPVTEVLLLIGAAVAVLAGIGVLRFSSPYARFHAAGKASPVAFLIVAIGAALETGWVGAVRLGVAGAAMVLTLPVAVHLLFRAVHRSTKDDDDASLGVDDLAAAESDPAPDRPATRQHEQGG